MSRRANPTLVGGFVAVALALIVGSAVYLGSARFGGDWYNFSVYFEGSAAGLQVGAPVVLKGVTIGSVTNIQVGFYPEEEDFIVPVDIQIDKDKIRLPGEVVEDFTLSKLTDQGLRARLDLQSILTGQLRVELGFFPDTQVQYRGRPARYPEIPSIPSAMETLRQALETFPTRDLAASVVRIVNGLDELVNSPQIGRMLDDLQAAIADVRNLTSTLEQAAEPLVGNIDGTFTEVGLLARDARQTLAALDEDLKQATSDARALVGDLRTSAEPAMDEFRGAARSARSAFDSAGRTFDSAGDLVGRESALRHELMTLMRDLSDAARSLKVMADYLERHPDALIRGKR